MPKLDRKALWEEYVASGKALRPLEQLIEAYRGIAINHAKHEAKKHKEIPEEYLGPALQGLMEAIVAFDPAENNNFTKFANRYVRGRIIDWCRDTARNSRMFAVYMQMIDKERHRLAQIVDRPVRFDEAAESLGLKKRITRWVSLTARTYNQAPSEEADHDDFEDPKQKHPSYELEKKEVWKIALRGLTKLQKTIVILYFIEDLTMREIGDAVGLSESRVSQLIKDACYELKDLPYVRYLADL